MSHWFVLGGSLWSQGSSEHTMEEVQGLLEGVRGGLGSPPGPLPVFGNPPCMSPPLRGRSCPLGRWPPAAGCRSIVIRKCENRESLRGLCGVEGTRSRPWRRTKGLLQGAKGGPGSPPGPLPGFGNPPALPRGGSARSAAGRHQPSAAGRWLIVIREFDRAWESYC